jgi:hypothetical protein
VTADLAHFTRHVQDTWPASPAGEDLVERYPFCAAHLLRQRQQTILEPTIGEPSGMAASGKSRQMYDARHDSLWIGRLLPFELLTKCLVQKAVRG